MKRSLSICVVLGALLSAAPARAFNHVSVWRCLGLGWGAGYHSRNAGSGGGDVVVEEVRTPPAEPQSGLQPIASPYVARAAHPQSAVVAPSAGVRPLLPRFDPQSSQFPPGR
jgi:hypothetical protein